MSWNNGGYSRSRGDDSMALLNIMLLGSLIDQARGANAAPVETLGEPMENPRVTHGQPSANPGETQRVPKTPENGALAAETPPFFPGKTPESGGVDRSEGCAICTPTSTETGTGPENGTVPKPGPLADWPPPDGSAPGPGLVDDACLAPDVTPPSRQHRDQSVTLRDAAVTTAQGWCNWCGLPETVIPSQRQSHAESLPRSLPETPTQESASMIVNPSAMPSDAMSQQQVRALNAEFDAGRVTAALTGQVLRVPKRSAGTGPTAAQVQALSGALDAAGKLHAQAFGSNTIRGLIDELGKCQQALAGFLPKGDPADIAPAATPSEAHASPLEATGEQGASESRHHPHAVNTLVATAYRATRDNLAAMQAARDELSMQMAHQRERLLDLQEHFGSEEDAVRAMQTYLGPHP